MEWGHTLLTLVILIGLELALGVDNLVYLTLVAERLPEAQQPSARRVGLSLALITRLLLLSLAFWASTLNHPIFSIGSLSFSARDCLFIGGGLFLFINSAKEFFLTYRQAKEEVGTKRGRFVGVVIQIMLFDIVFSLDSVITAIGVAKELWIMMLAIVIAVVIMLFASDWLSGLIKAYPRLRRIAIGFLILLGLVLIIDGFSIELPRWYLYIGLGFALFVEILSILYKKINADS